jgi:hypothetical protein
MVGLEGNMSLKNLVTPPGIDPGTVRLVAQRLNHYDTPGPKICQIEYDITERNLKKLTSMNQTVQQQMNKISCYMFRHYKCALIILHCGLSGVFEMVRCKQHRHTLAPRQKFQSIQTRKKTDF